MKIWFYFDKLKFSIAFVIRFFFWVWISCEYLWRMNFFSSWKDSNFIFSFHEYEIRSKEIETLFADYVHDECINIAFFYHMFSRNLINERERFTWFWKKEMKVNAYGRFAKKSNGVTHKGGKLINLSSIDREFILL